MGRFRVAPKRPHSHGPDRPALPPARSHRRVVHIATNVKLEVVGFDLVERHAPRVAGDVHVALKGGCDLLDVLRADVVLGAAGEELGVGVNEQNAVAPLRRLAASFRSHHEQACRNA